MKRIFKICTLIFCVSTSCVDLDTPPLNYETDLTYWESPTAAIESVNACYKWLPSATNVLYNDAATDNAYCKADGFNQSIGNGSYSTDDSYIKSYWDNQYGGIKMCNRLAENIHRVPNLTPELHNRYLAEARFLRAFYYFNLVNKFGDVPYTTKVISIAEAGSIPQTPKETIINNILAELDAIIAANYLPASYPAEDFGRITQWAVKTLKARILMCGSRWEELKVVTEDIMSAGFTLHLNYGEMFEVAHEVNNEVILSTQYVKTHREHSTQYNFLPPTLGGYAQLSPLQELVDSYLMMNGKSIKEAGSNYDESKPYEGRDPRLTATIIYDGNKYIKADGSEAVIWTQKGSDPDGLNYSSNATPTGYYFKKYWDKDYHENHMSGLDIVLMRYADVLLMNAEAHAETNTLTAAVWDRTIKIIRERAGFTESSALDFPTISNDAKIDVIRNERRVELAFEGSRRLDIMRWQIAEDVLNGWCHGIFTGDVVGADNGYIRIEERQFTPTKHYLWPIPQADIYLNASLSQNDNW